MESAEATSYLPQCPMSAGPKAPLVQRTSSWSMRADRPATGAGAWKRIPVAARGIKIVGSAHGQQWNHDLRLRSTTWTTASISSGVSTTCLNQISDDTILERAELVHPIVCSLPKRRPGAASLRKTVLVADAQGRSATSRAASSSVRLEFVGHAEIHPEWASG